jgi:hypothetical protein
MGLLNTRTRYVARPKPACRVVYHLSRLPSRYGFPINGCIRGGRNLAAFDTVTPPLSVQGRPRYRWSEGTPSLSQAQRSTSPPVKPIGDWRLSANLLLKAGVKVRVKEWYIPILLKDQESWLDSEMPQLKAVLTYYFPQLTSLAGFRACKSLVSADSLPLSFLHRSKVTPLH